MINHKKPKYNGMMNWTRRVSLLLIVIVNLLLVADLFMHPGRPATFDGPTHLTTMVQFYSSLKQGEFPVRWSGGYGNYGQPMPLYAHQLTAYTGAAIIFLTHNPDIAYALIALVAAIASGIAMYSLLLPYAGIWPAALGALLFSVSPYRLANLYVRGGLPEFVASVWLLLMLILIRRLFKTPKPLDIPLSITVALLVLTHPIIAALSLLFVALAVLVFRPAWQRRFLFPLVISIFLSLMFSAYYLVPFIVESKYLYVGHEHAVVSFVDIGSYLNERWPYLTQGSHPGPRPNIIQFGLIETVLVLTGLIFIRFRPYRPLVIISILGVMLTLPLSEVVYSLIPPLAKIQYSFRWFTVLSLLPPLFLVLWLRTRSSSRLKVLCTVIIFVVVGLRLTQAYGKNYHQVPFSDYTHTVATLHTANLNTVWMGHWRDYPPKTLQAEIIEGQGAIKAQEIGNTKRVYEISAATPIRFVDYTFYFPGWQLLVNGQAHPIEFQDPDFRGIITFTLPPGQHHVFLSYKNTKVRTLGNLISLVAITLIPIITIVKTRQVTHQSRRFDE
jgi:hypothetical protein